MKRIGQGLGALLALGLIGLTGCTRESATADAPNGAWNEKAGRPDWHATGTGISAVGDGTQTPGISSDANIGRGPGGSSGPGNRASGPVHRAVGSPGPTGQGQGATPPGTGAGTGTTGSGGSTGTGNGGNVGTPLTGGGR